MYAFVRKSLVYLTTLSVTIFAASVARADWLYEFDDGTIPETFRINGYTDPGSTATSDTCSGSVEFPPDVEGGVLRLIETRTPDEGGALSMNGRNEEVFSDVRVTAIINPTGDGRGDFGLGARSPDPQSEPWSGYFVAFRNTSETANPGFLYFVKLVNGNWNQSDTAVSSGQLTDFDRSYFLQMDVVDDEFGYPVITGGLFEDADSADPLLAVSFTDTSGSPFTSGTSSAFAGRRFMGSHITPNATLDNLSARALPESTTLIWDGLGDGNWNDVDPGSGRSRWIGESGVPRLVYPSASIDAVVQADTVNVTANRVARALRLESGALNLAASAMINLADDLMIEDGAFYACRLDAAGGSLIAAAGDAHLGGTLALEAIGQVGAVGDTSRTIIQIEGEEGVVVGAFAVEPAEGEHLGYGVFHQAMTYNADSVAVDLFQAAAGDTDGNREIDNTDLQSILAANSFNSPGQWDWTQGDFNADGLVRNDDLQLVLATGYFGTGPYAAVTPSTSEAGLILVPEPGTFVMFLGAALGLLLVRRRMQKAVGYASACPHRTSATGSGG